jgi:hypothetical protein
MRALRVNSNALSNGVVSYPTIAEIRRANLQRLIDERGTQRALADAADVSPAQISQWIKAAPDSKTGKPRVVSDESARALEACSGKPVGWMDHLHGDQPSCPATPAVSPPTLEQALEVLGIVLARDMAEEVRDDAADALAKLARRRGSARDQAQLLHLLQPMPSQHTGADG